MRLLGDVIRINAQRYPRKKALIMGDESLTYYELNEQVNRVASALRSLGIVPGDSIVILAPNCLEYVSIVYAVLKCGGICVPANFRYKASELAYVVNNAKPKLLFYSSDLKPLEVESRPEFGLPVQSIAISGEGGESGLILRNMMEHEPTTEPAIELDPSQSAFIMYTSGTTGFPKGVLFSHLSYLTVAAGMIYEGDLRHNDIMMVNMPIFHNAGINAMILPTLMVAGTCLITSGSFDPHTILSMVSQYGVTATMWVPTMLARLINHPDVLSYDTTSLKKIWYGSSAINPTVLEAAQKVFKAGFYQWYGQTETGMVSVLRPEDHAERSQFTGRAIYNAEIRIVDEDGKDSPVGEVGEIITAQKPLGMKGYYDQEEATKRAIKNGWVHTEDLARVEEDGYFTVVDRLRDMIISGAENIYPKEIEDVICGHEGVEEAAAFGIPDEIWGESVCVAVVQKKGYKLTEADIIAFCGAKLSNYKKPKLVEFKDELPKNAVGKVTKNALREPYWAGRAKRI